MEPNLRARRFSRLQANYFHFFLADRVPFASRRLTTQSALGQVDCKRASTQTGASSGPICLSGVPFARALTRTARTVDCLLTRAPLALPICAQCTCWRQSGALCALEARTIKARLKDKLHPGDTHALSWRGSQTRPCADLLSVDRVLWCARC